MLNTKSAPWPSFTQEEADAVSNVLLSNRVNYWTGEECRSFEREFAPWSDSEYAIAVTNGTVALDLALQGLGIGSANGGRADDEVIVTPRTFIASISCVVNAGAVPVFADVDRDSGNICPATIAERITNRTRAVIPVHLAGWPCDMDNIMALADDHGFAVIEDCAQAHGAQIGGRSVGSIGHIGAWSFCQDKIMTTGGEGGMVTTNDKALWSTMWSFKDHGKSWEAVYERQHAPGFRWVHESFGTNWRMLEMQAAIGRIQLGRMAAWTQRRAEIATSLADALARFPDAVRVPRPSTELRHAYYRLYAYIRPDGLRDGWTRDRIVEALVTAGVQAFHGTCSEVYLEKAFDNSELRPAERLPIARELGETSLMFLTHPTMSDAELSRACDAIARVLDEATH
jgi:dTDP-4-amino-4,6-dideoxygalactose transaminase